MKLINTVRRVTDDLMMTMMMMMKGKVPLEVRRSSRGQREASVSDRLVVKTA